MDPHAEAGRVLAALRLHIKSSPLSQRKIEERAGFSRGYLSQLLTEKLELKVVHIMAVLDVLEVPPAHFFAALYPAARPTALDRFKHSSRLDLPELNQTMDALYGLGLESLHRLRHRLARCEDAVEQLEDLGLLPSDHVVRAKRDRR